MSNVVDLLEKIGQSSRLQALGGEQLAQELSQAGIDPAVQAAIVQQRPRELEQLIGAPGNVCCLIHAPQDDENDEPDEQPDEDKSLALSTQPHAERVARAG